MGHGHALVWRKRRFEGMLSKQSNRMLANRMLFVAM